MKTPCLLLAVLATAVSAAAQSSDDQVVKLPPLEVADQGSNGYNVSTSTSATRMNTPIIDIPQTVDIVTSQFWRDTDATSFDESFKYVANAYVRNRNAGGGDNINIRGFQTSASIAVDGVLVGSQQYKRDLVGYDRLEVVKGPPSAVQGRAGGSGLFNYILKKPELDGDWTTVKYITGTDDFSDTYNRVEADSNYVLANGQAGARIAASWGRSDDYIKFQHFSNLSVYPSFRWKIGKNTEIIWTNEMLKDLSPSREEGHGFADYPYKLRKLIPQFNVPTDPILALHLPYNFNIAGPGENAYEKVLSSTLFLTHEFNEHISYRQVANWRNNSINSATFTGEDNSDTIINSQFSQSISEYHNATVQGDLIANWKWPWLNSSTLVGYNYRDYGTITQSLSGVPAAPFNTINLIALAAMNDSPDYFAGRHVTPATTTYTVANSYNLGEYAEEDLGLFGDKLILNGSVRRDHDHTETDSLITLKQTAGSNTQLTSYRYGVTYKILPVLSAYAVESLQNDPPTTVQKYNGLLAGDPRLNEFFTVTPNTKLYEYGLKGEAFGGRLSFSADHWEMLRTGSVVNLLQNGTSQGQNVTFGTQTVLQGAESHGFEFSTYGSVTDKLSVVANYTRMFTSQQNSADPGNPGDLIALQYAPIWNYNVWAKYQLWETKDQGLELKGGLIGIGPFWGQVTLSTGGKVIYIPHSQKNIDAGLGYRWRRYNFDVMVTNVDDDPFLITRDQPPRTYRFSVGTRF